MQKFLSARYDKVFKAIFGDEENLDLTKRLLELILHKKVKDIKVRNPELIKRYAYERGKMVDLIFDVDGNVVQMEMNNGYPAWLHFRNFNFFTVIINKDARKGSNYESKKIYLLIDFTYGLGSTNSLETEYKVQSSDHKEYLSNVSILEFSMDEIGRLWYTASDEDARTLFRYLSIFDMDEEELNALPRGEDEFMDKFRDKVIELNQDEEFVRFATDEEDLQMMLNSERTVGKDEGREERNIEIAKSMLEKKCDISLISEVTGLSIEDIEKLKKA